MDKHIIFAVIGGVVASLASFITFGTPALLPAIITTLASLLLLYGFYRIAYHEDLTFLKIAVIIAAITSLGVVGAEGPGLAEELSFNASAFTSLLVAGFGIGLLLLGISLWPVHTSMGSFVKIVALAYCFAGCLFALGAILSIIAIDPYFGSQLAFFGVIMTTASKVLGTLLLFRAIRTYS